MQIRSHLSTAAASAVILLAGCETMDAAMFAEAMNSMNSSLSQQQQQQQQQQQMRQQQLQQQQMRQQQLQQQLQQRQRQEELARQQLLQQQQARASQAQAQAQAQAQPARTAPATSQVQAQQARPTSTQQPASAQVNSAAAARTPQPNTVRPTTPPQLSTAVNIAPPTPPVAALADSSAAIGSANGRLRQSPCPPNVICDGVDPRRLRDNVDPPNGQVGGGSTGGGGGSSGGSGSGGSSGGTPGGGSSGGGSVPPTKAPGGGTDSDKERARREYFDTIRAGADLRAIKCGGDKAYYITGKRPAPKPQLSYCVSLNFEALCPGQTVGIRETFYNHTNSTGCYGDTHKLKTTPSCPVEQVRVRVLEATGCK